MKPPAKAKLKAAKKKAASSEKPPGSDRVKGALLGGAISTNEPLVGADETSGIERMLVILLYILLFSLPVLLMIAALRNIVQYNVAHGYEDIRIPVVLCGLFVLAIEGFLFLLMR